MTFAHIGLAQALHTRGDVAATLDMLRVADRRLALARNGALSQPSPAGDRTAGNIGFTEGLAARRAEKRDTASRSIVDRRIGCQSLLREDKVMMNVMIA
jgi:hypothetical protein